jgi:hypothetical protein
VNSSDWKDTDESFDVVALHSSDLHDAVLAIKIDPKVLRRLSLELRFSTECTGVPLPFLPVHGEDEANLFVRLVLVVDGAFHVDHCMALEWYKFVDGKTIFPKLPVYPRAYFDRYLRNRRVQDAVSPAWKVILSCMQLNKELVPEDLMEQDQVSRVDDLTPVHDSGDDTEGMEIRRAAVGVRDQTQAWRL